MKDRTLILLLIFIIAVLFVAVSCATDNMIYISKEYEIYGTWVNPDNKNIGQRFGKIVFHPNGRMELYGADTGPGVDSKGQWTRRSEHPVVSRNTNYLKKPFMA